MQMAENRYSDATHCQALIIGAGPAGLFAAFQLGLLEVKAQIIDCLPKAGGQCAQLYPDKLIYDLPGIPACSGLELRDRLLQQLEPFHIPIQYKTQVTALEQIDAAHFYVKTSQAQEFICQKIIIAAGTGAFLPKKLKLPGLEQYEGKQVFYFEAPSSIPESARVVVYGADDHCFEMVRELSTKHSVTWIYRRDELELKRYSPSDLDTLVHHGQVQRITAQIRGFTRNEGRLSGFELLDSQGEEYVLPGDYLIASTGLSPQLGPIAHWGLALQQKLIPVHPGTFVTDIPGIYAVGDINTYVGKKKLIVCGFHEASLAAYDIGSHLNPSRQELLYTTSSSKLQELLGVKNQSH